MLLLFHLDTMNAKDFFFLEPILSEGTDMVEILEDDGWTAVTEDGSRSAQFEHTVLITNDGCEILTLSEDCPTNDLVE
jgi:methionyl aminopeptidase